MKILHDVSMTGIWGKKLQGVSRIDEQILVLEENHRQ